MEVRTYGDELEFFTHIMHSQECARPQYAKEWMRPAMSNEIDLLLVVALLEFEEDYPETCCVGEWEPGHCSSSNSGYDMNKILLIANHLLPSANQLPI